MKEKNFCETRNNLSMPLLQNGKRELVFHFVTFLSNSKINPSEKKTGNKSTFTTNTNLLIYVYERRTVEVDFLLFAGKTNAMLYLETTIHVKKRLAIFHLNHENALYFSLNHFSRLATE